VMVERSTGVTRKTVTQFHGRVPRSSNPTPAERFGQSTRRSGKLGVRVLHRTQSGLSGGQVPTRGRVQRRPNRSVLAVQSLRVAPSSEAHGNPNEECGEEDQSNQFARS
jgi:hypothetical protein